LVLVGIAALYAMALSIIATNYRALQITKKEPVRVIENE
jgi:ABC-type lipoprotein release transport system permease subunit